MSTGRLFVAIGIAALAAGSALFVLMRPVPRVPPARVEAPEISPSAVLAASFEDGSGRSRSLAEFQGKVLVVNFWATWCKPCLEEIPVFVKMQQKFGAEGLQFVGIAIDNPVKVREFAAKYQMNYPVLIGEMEAIELARAAGNTLGGLPFTVILDRKGRLIRTEIGGLNERKLIPIIQPSLLGNGP